MSRKPPAWARWRNEYLGLEMHHTSIITSQGEHGVVLAINAPSLFFINPNRQEPVFVVDLSRSICNVSGTTGTILHVKVVQSLVAHPTFVENGRIRFRSRSQAQRDHLAACIKSSLVSERVGVHLGHGVGETSTEGPTTASIRAAGGGGKARERGNSSSRIKPVAIDNLTVRKLSTTAMQVREVCDRLGLLDKVLATDLRLAAKLITTEHRLLLGLRQTLLVPSGDDGECIKQLQLITMSVLGHALPWTERGAQLLNAAVRAEDFSGATMSVVGRHLERIFLFSELLAWVTHAHVVFTQPSTNQETAELALRLSQVYCILAERPRTQQQLTTLVARLTWAAKDVLAMINVAHTGREVEGDLRDAILTAVQAGMALQDATCKFVLSPPFPFEFDVVVAHCFRLGGAILEILHTAAASEEWDFLDFDLALHVDWAQLDPIRPYTPAVVATAAAPAAGVRGPQQHASSTGSASSHARSQQQQGLQRLQHLRPGKAGLSKTDSGKSFFETFTTQSMMGVVDEHRSPAGTGMPALGGDGASDEFADFDDDEDDYEDEAELSKMLADAGSDPLGQAIRVNERYRDLADKRLQDAQRLCKKAEDPQGVGRLGLVAVLERLVEVCNKLVCVDARDAPSVPGWPKAVSDFYEQTQEVARDVDRLCRENRRRAVLSGPAVEVVMEEARTGMNTAEKLLGDLETILREQKAALERNKQRDAAGPLGGGAKQQQGQQQGQQSLKDEDFGDTGEPGYMTMQQFVPGVIPGAADVGGADDDDDLYTSIAAPRVPESLSDAEGEGEEAGSAGEGSRARTSSMFSAATDDEVLYLTHSNLKHQQDQEKKGKQQQPRQQQQHQHQHQQQEEEQNGKEEQDGDGKRVLAAATLTQLVWRITRSERFDPKLLSAVILTYHSFTTGRELLDLLIARFEESLDTAKGVGPMQDADGFQIRARVLNAIKRWLIDNAEDFRNPDLMEQLKAFLRKHAEHPSVSQLQTMAAHVDAFRRQSTANIFADSGARRMMQQREDTPGGEAGEQKQEDVDDVDGFELISSVQARPQLDLCQLGPRETAEQLTLWHWKQYEKLTPHDLIGKKAEKSLTKKMLAKHSNVVTFWVMASILSRAQRAKRAARLKYMVRLADMLLSLGNFDLFYFVYLGITHSSILRLKQTWKLFRDKHRRSSALYDKHERLCKDMHFGLLRPLLRERHLQGQPCIPPIPMFNNDLLRRENAFADTVDNNGIKLINMTKRRNLVEAIEEIRGYQRLAYNLPAKEIIQTYLETQFVNQVPLTSLEAADRSRAIEPPAS